MPLGFLISLFLLLLLLFSHTVSVCIDDVDDVKANGSRSAQELPTGFAHAIRCHPAPQPSQL